MKEDYKLPNYFVYLLARFASWILTHFIFHRQVLRNEIKHTKGGFVVIANHECALDFVNLIGLCNRRMTFVISRSFYSTLPLRGLFDRMGVISKQQFQTSLKDIKQMKSVVDSGAPLVIYPAGMMCEDGISTPIPHATGSLLRLLDVDVYMARTSGTYHVMPKWTSGVRPGKTYMDVYRLFSKDELHSLSKEEIKSRSEKALDFDAYADQEGLKVIYHNGDNVEGLENVVYQCPCCHNKYTIKSSGNTLSCDACDFTTTSDCYGFLRSTKNGPKHVSQWKRDILTLLENNLENRKLFSLPVSIHTLNETKPRFDKTGFGTATLTEHEISLEGEINGKPISIKHNVVTFPILPFTPGKCFEIQDGLEIYRCYPDEGKYVMEFIDLLKLWNRRAQKALRNTEEA